MAYKYLEGCRINPDAPQDSLETKVPYVDNGTATVDPSRFYSREFMEHEWRGLWTRAWLIAGVEADIRKPGDYSTFDVLREQILVVRQKDHSVKAFYNVCPHRGNRLVHSDRGNVPQFTCGFHSWQFRLNGELRSITDRETFRDEVVSHNPCLTELRCETHAGLVFINMDADAPPLTERLGLPPGYLEAYNLDQMFVVRHVVSEWAANWKTGVDAFYESYHLHAVHPETRTMMGDLNVQYDLYPHGASRMIVPLGQKSPRLADQETVDDSLKYMMSDVGIDAEHFDGSARDVRPAIQKAKRERANVLKLDYGKLTDGQLTDSWATGIFPNVQIGLHPEGAFLMRFMPHPTDPERFFYDTMTLFRPTPDPKYKAPDWMGIPKSADLSGAARPETEYVPLGEPPKLGLVLDQDSELLPVVQQGIRSRGFRGPLWSEQEQRLRHFHAEVDRYLDGEK